MPPRKTNDTFLDKFLGVFGIKRPKKKKRVVSKRKDIKIHNDVEINNGFEIPLNDDFQIVSQNNEEQNENNNRENIRKNSDYKARQRRYEDDMEEIKNRKVQGGNNSKKDKKRHPVLKGLLSVFLVIVITGCIVVGAALIYVFAFIDDTVDADLYNLKLEYTSILYAKDSKGKDVELTRLHGEQNRLWVDNKDIPENVSNAFISCEDKRFREHSGTDWKRTISAAANQVFHFYGRTEGGSSITQQLVKNITGDDEVDWTRKIREIMRARYLEQHYDKDTILECYLNTIHLGNGVDGVEVASNYYFDKHVSDINLTQAACLAAITNNPSDNEPYGHPETNKNRRNWVLNEMYKNGYISEDECENAKNADLGLRESPSTVLSTTKTVKEEYNSYFVDAVIEDVIKGLVEEKGYTKEHASNQLYKGGYKIYTTVDLDMQKKLEKVYKNDDNFMQVYSNSGNKPQSAMTIMDYKGNVKAIIGGRGEKKGNRVLNRATQSPRPTGSAIKPISAYAPAFEYNIITWGSTIEDSPVSKLENGVVPDEKWPKNYDNTYSYGKTTMLRAIQKSLNTIPVKLVQEMSLDTSYKFVTEKMGLEHFTPYENGQSDKTESSLALGGSVHGATTLEMAAAFSTFGNGGIYYEPRTYTKVLDQNNDVVIDMSDSDKQHRAISEGTAGIMCKMLQTVATDGTGTASQFGDWQIMCKTGTTSNNKDRWFVGGTPYYMAACWFGIDKNEEMRGMYMNPAIILWKAAMSSIHEDLKLKKFEISDKAEYRRYCTTSGLCARSGCPSTAYGYFKSSYTPYCTYHGGSEIGKSSEPDYDSYYHHDNGGYNKTTAAKTTKSEKTTDVSQNTTVTGTSGQGETTSNGVQTTNPTDGKTNAPTKVTDKKEPVKTKAKKTNKKQS